MSHFSVMVIGQNVAAQLQPYHEFECTGTNDEFVQDIDVTAEIKERMTGDGAETLDDALGFYGLEDKIVDDESKVEKVGDECAHKYGFAIVKDGQLVRAVTRTNPNKTWDWWVVGGRWSGFLKLKPGSTGELGERGLMGSCANAGAGRADVALKGSIDIAGMRDEAGTEAAATWDKAAAAKVAAGLDENTTWESWDAVRAKHPGDIEAARTEYHAQPAKAAISKVFDSFFFNADALLVGREAYIEQARNAALSPYALVKDGQWFAKGRMGWWGMSDDKLTQDDWNRKVCELLNSLPDETQITIVDCHI